MTPQTGRPIRFRSGPAPMHTRGASSRRARRGMTLIELVVALAVGVVILTTAVPSFFDVIQDNRLTTQANDFATVLAQGRSEARKRRLQTTVCKSANGTACSTAAAVQWEDGWILFVDLDRDAAIDDNDLILRTGDGLSHDSTLRPSTAFANYIAFMSDGRAIGSGSTTPPAQGTFRICDKRGATVARELRISPIGRAAVEPDHGTAACP